MKTLKIAGWVVVTVLIIDMLCFTAWTLSGQYPVDNFYIGTITTHLLKIIIN